MAIIGEELTTPEVGWKRINKTNDKFIYSGLGWGTDQTSQSPGDKLTFKFRGTKLRIISHVGNMGTDVVEIIVDGATPQTFTCINPQGESRYNGMQYEIVGLENKSHSVVMTNKCTNWQTGQYRFGFVAIDIDDTGDLVDPNEQTLNLTAIAGDSKVTLSWDAVTGATGYHVKRSTTAGGPYTTVGSNVTGTSYVDTSVTNGTTYYYVVTALNGTDESVNSNEASATPTAGTVIPPVTTGNKLLRVTMIDSSEREYRLSTDEIDGFVNWYARTIGTGISCYALNDIVDDSKEYLVFEKIISFKVIPLVK